MAGLQPPDWQSCQPRSHLLGQRTRRMCKQTKPGSCGWPCRCNRMRDRYESARVNEVDRNARQCRLVDDKEPQLEKGPAMECRALRPSSPHPRPNMRQILQRYRPLRAFGRHDNLFAEVVVRPCGEPAFLPRQLLQAAACAVSALPLELVPQAPMPIADVLDRPPLVDRPITIDGDVRHAHVNAQDTFYIRRGRLLNIRHGEQVPFPPDGGKVGFSMLGGKQLPLPLTAHERDGLSPIQRPDRDRGIRQRLGQDTVVVGDSPMRSECPTHTPIELVGVSHLSQRPDRHLRGQPECLAYRVIADLLHVELATGLRVPGDTADVVARRVCRFQCSPECVGLIRRRKEFQLCGDFHRVSVLRSERLCKCTLKRAKAGALPPTAKAAGLPRLKASYP